MGIKDSNEAELPAMIKALDLSSTRDEVFGRKFTVEPDYAFVVYWMNNQSIRPWRFHEVFILKRGSSITRGFFFLSTRRLSSVV